VNLESGRGRQAGHKTGQGCVLPGGEVVTLDVKLEERQTGQKRLVKIVGALASIPNLGRDFRLPAGALEGRRRITFLLNHMCELVGQKATPVCSVRGILTRRENDVPRNGVSQCVDSSCRFGGSGVRMHLHSTEVVTKPRFHEAARAGIQLLSGGAQHLAYGRRCWS